MQSIVGKQLVNLLAESTVGRLLSLEALRGLHTSRALNMPAKVFEILMLVYHNILDSLDLTFHTKVVCKGKSLGYVPNSDVNDMASRYF